jgi:transaldolase
MDMQFFIDTADTEAIRHWTSFGIVDGVTTNPSLIAKSGRDYGEVVKEICAITDGPVSAEVVALEAEQMISEGRSLAKIADNVVVKLPLIDEGLKACAALTAAGIKTNVTLCFSAAQGLLAAKVGATYISPFIGRLDDISADGMGLIEDLRAIYDIHGFETRILAASIRTLAHVTDSALAGAEVATVPPALFKQMIAHPLTDKGLEQFLSDWKSTGQSIQVGGATLK